MRNIKIIFCSIILIFVTMIGGMTLINRNESSTLENRKLSTFPRFKINQMLDADYLNSISLAVGDQLKFRSSFVKLYYKISKDILKQTYIGTVIIGMDQVLFNAPMKMNDYELEKQNIENSVKKLNEVNEVAKKYGTKMIVVHIPRKDIVLSDYLPSYYQNSKEQYLYCLEFEKSNLSKDISLVDVYSLFEENREKDSLYFYYNDHHINPIGNDIILSEIIKIVKKEYPNVEQYGLDKYEILHKQVSGSFNKKIAMIAKAPDEPLNLLPQKWDFEYERYDNGVISDIPILNTDSNSYNGSYMGGNFGETIVKTNREQLPSILYCGSSFTNALEALSVPSFNTMYSIDFRNNNTDNTLIEYIETWKPEYVVLISAQSTATFKYSHLLMHLGLEKNLDQLDE